MKQIYSRTELLSLRHECQELLVRSFFSTCRSLCVFPDSPPTPSHHFKRASRYPLSFHLDYNPKYPRAANEGSTNIYAAANFLETNPEDQILKGNLQPLESFQLVKIPLSLGELPPGSKIIKVRPGIPVPENAIPISIADISSVENTKHAKSHKRNEPSPVVASSRWNNNGSNKWDIDYETPSYDGVTNFAAGVNANQNCDQINFAPVGGAASEDAATAVDTGTKLGPATRASSETWASSETKFHYARFFEPYMRKFLSSTREAKKTLAPQKNMAPSTAITPTTSCEAESATGYSSDSSNIQIQLPA